MDTSDHGFIDRGGFCLPGVSHQATSSVLGRGTEIVKHSQSLFVGRVNSFAYDREARWKMSMQQASRPTPPVHTSPRSSRPDSPTTGTTNLRVSRPRERASRGLGSRIENDHGRG